MSLTAEQEKWIATSSREEVNGWIYLRVGGEPFARGFQHGFHIADEWNEARRVYSAMTFQEYGLTYEFFQENAVRLHKSKLGDEITAEMEGIAAGLTAAGVPATLDDVIGWNAWMEITGYWYPTVADQYAKAGPKQPRHSHCSAFIATGSATTDGKIVVGHTSFDEFWAGAFFNVILDLTPSDGHRMVMQSIPGYVGSFTDFWISSAGLVVTETTIGAFRGYDETRVPEYVRSRKATQYATSIDEWVAMLNQDNNGGYANSWLVGDINTGEIARYDEGLVYQNLERTTDGSFYGDNAPADPRIMHLESGGYGYNDIRWPTGARRVRWVQLLDGYHGEIDAQRGQAFLGDTFDPYLGYNNPSMRTICSHYDADPLYHFAGHDEPYVPFGSVDGKLATADDIAKMSMWGRFGRADGIAFDAHEHLRQHPQFNWQAGYLHSRPSQPWTYFDNGATVTERPDPQE
ncbi:C45 family autoproteolytic acyltransferase/hydrolase [Microbacterium koreense]|uniref:C45 family autoproteolytic acyltransferase/hydrolase n=1 Tax=Microbacterium koreense TaxID=323761 RepID=A0ABW2ZVB6_9MICO